MRGWAAGLSREAVFSWLAPAAWDFERDDELPAVLREALPALPSLCPRLLARRSQKGRERSSSCGGCTTATPWKRRHALIPTGIASPSPRRWAAGRAAPSCASEIGGSSDLLPSEMLDEVFVREKDTARRYPGLSSWASEPAGTIWSIVLRFWSFRPPVGAPSRHAHISLSTCGLTENLTNWLADHYN